MMEKGWKIPINLNRPCKTPSPRHSSPLNTSMVSSGQDPPQELRLQSGAFTFSQLPGYTFSHSPFIPHIQSQDTSEQSKPMDTASLQSFSLSCRSHTASEEYSSCADLATLSSSRLYKPASSKPYSKLPHLSLILSLSHLSNQDSPFLHGKQPWVVFLIS